MPDIEHTYTERPETVSRNLRLLADAGLDFGGKRILDLGCGTGAYSAGLLDMGAKRVVGVDIAPGNIALASQRHDHPGLHFVCADVLAADGPEAEASGPFELVFMRGTAYYLPVPMAQALTAVAALLAPRGELFLTMLAPTPRARAVNLVKRCAATTPKALRPLVRNMGATLYAALVRLTSGPGADREAIREKMSTLFYPAHHLLPAATMERELRSLGFTTRILFEAQGEHPQFSDEYGIICFRSTTHTSHTPNPATNGTQA